VVHLASNFQQTTNPSCHIGSRRALSGVDWSLSGVDWSLSGVDWSLSGVDWSLSGVDWSLSEVDWSLSEAEMTNQLRSEHNLNLALTYRSVFKQNTTFYQKQ